MEFCKDKIMFYTHLHHTRMAFLEFENNIFIDWIFQLVVYVAFILLTVIHNICNIAGML